jgi:hypothetical protein
VIKRTTVTSGIVLEALDELREELDLPGVQLDEPVEVFRSLP